MTQYDFKDLTFSFPDYCLKLGRYIIPIKIHIANIKFPNNSTLELSLEDDEYMGFEFGRFKEINNAKENLIHINTSDKLFNNFKCNFLEYHNLKEVDEVLEYLDIFDLSEFNKSIHEKIPFMVETFRKRLYNSLKLDIKPPAISYKPDKEKPQNIKDYLQYTNNYIFLQSLIEFSSNPFFNENNGKTPDLWSLREYETRMAYITAKNRFESTENLWQLASMKIDK